MILNQSFLVTFSCLHFSKFGILGFWFATWLIYKPDKTNEFDNFKIKIAGEREKEKIPSLWESVEVTFELYGNIDLEKAKKAAALSMEKHCSVAETLRRGGTQIKWDVKVINTEKVLA